MEVLRTDVYKRQACDCLSPDDIDRLHENIAIQKYYYETSKPNKLLECDIRFHGEIYRICKKEFLSDVISNLSIHFDRIRYLSMTKREFILKISEHENYLHALENGDVQAAMAISCLLYTSSRPGSGGRAGRGLGGHHRGKSLLPLF